MTTPTLARVIRVLIVDDSAFARKVVREMLSSSPLIEVVGAARDGQEALEMVEELQPDVVTCDLEMPRFNGGDFVRRQMALRPLPILILSAAAQNTSEVLDALDAGAIDVVQKPSALATDQLRSVQEDLIAKVKVAAGAAVKRALPPLSAPAPADVAAARVPTVEIVVIGISTGGPQALRQMLPLFPADFPVPIAIVLHMPIGYTALYAQKLNEICQIEVKEAADGDVLRPGRALLAAAGRHLVLRRAMNDEIVAQLTVQPMSKVHRPSVDVLFQSAAEVFRERVLAVVMTGMGEDGKEGAAWVKAQGGAVLTEAETSCIIYGMPRSVMEAGLSDAAVPLEGMAHAIATRL